MRVLRGKKKYSKKKVLEKIMAPPPEKPFRRDWLEKLKRPYIEGLQYIKDLPSVQSDA